MFKALAPGLLISSLLISVSAVDNGFSRCNCDEEGFWSIESILECQRVSDFLIAVAYFSIPIELLYFVSCSNLPFKWVLFEFIAFIVLCGMTHLLNGWAYGPHSFQLMLALTIFKFLTALVSCATAITLLTLIPLLLKVKVRELFLKKKTWELDREVGMMKKQKETSWHVRMLTQEIRKSLDRHTILYTTLVELSKTLDLQNCVVWMPSDSKTEMNLTHELKGRSASKSYRLSIPVNDPDVLKIKESKGVQFLRPDSPLGAASSSGSDEPGAVAAIRVPLLSVLNFKGGTPEQIPTCYAILVLVLPTVTDRDWSDEVLEIVEVVADQVAVALSHAAVLEESQHMREKLVEQNHALQQAKTNAMMANQATNSFQKVMSHGMRRPMHSILGLLSIIQVEKMNFEQRIVVDTMMKTSSVLSTLINDVATSTKEQCRFSLERTSFQLHSMIKEAACLSKCLCVYRGLSFAIEVENSLPDQVIGDERRIFQVILHMVRNLLNGCERGGSVTFRIFSDSGSVGGTDQRWAVWKPVSSDGHRYVKFEIGIGSVDSPSEGLISTIQLDNRRQNSEGIEGGLSFSICKKLVQMMQGNIWVLPNSRGQAETMTLVLRLQLQSSIGRNIFETGESSEPPHSNSLFRGLQVILADADDVNRAVTKKLLEKLGCYVSSVSSGFECLSALGPAGTSFQIVFVDLHMPEMDGFEVASRIRKFRSRSWPLIVALTESADEDMWGKCMQTGMNGFIRKPVLLQGIANELRRVLQQANKGV